MNILVTGANGQLGQAIQLIAGSYPGFNFIYTDSKNSPNNGYVEESYIWFLKDM